MTPGTLTASRVDGWERDLGTHPLKGRKAVIAPSLGAAVVAAEVEAQVVEAGQTLARSAGLALVDVPVRVPNITVEWAMANQVTLRNELGDRRPDCAADMTLELAFGLRLAEQVWNLDMASRFERLRTEMNEAIAGSSTRSTSSSPPPTQTSPSGPTSGSLPWSTASPSVRRTTVPSPSLRTP